VCCVGKTRISEAEVQNDVVDNIIVDGHADYVVKTLVGHTEGFHPSLILLSLAELPLKHFL